MTSNIPELCPHCRKSHGPPYCCGCSYGACSGGFCPSLPEVVNGYFLIHGCKIEPGRRIKNQGAVRAHV